MIPIGTQSPDPGPSIEGEIKVATHSEPEGTGTGPGSGSFDRPSPSPPASEPDREAATELRRVRILNGLGFHLRPIERFVAVVQQHRAEVEVRYDGKRCNGRSILDLMSLAAECGAEIELAAAGSDAQVVLDALASLFAARFYEDDLGRLLEEPAR